MGVLSNKVNREDLKPGDHIYSWRNAYTYAHHGIYVGDGKVIHFTQGAAAGQGKIRAVSNKLIVSSCSSPAIPCPQCGDLSRRDGVLITCLDCFLSGGNVYRYEYGVSKTFFLAQVRGGTCTLAKSDPPHDVLHRANFLLENGFGDYDLSTNNCEDFALYCKTGLSVIPIISVGRSGQACSLKAVASAFSSPLGFVSVTCYSGVLGFCYGSYRTYRYCKDRLASDIGVRTDVEKVPVERLLQKKNSSLPCNHVATTLKM